MKNLFHPATVSSPRSLNPMRLAVQTGFTLFCLFAGWRFYHFYLWAKGLSPDYVPRPPSVEGFLPISALLGLKRFTLTGEWAQYHPAGLTIFITALLIGLLLRKGFCGWICPVGAVSNYAERVGRRFKILWRPPAWLDYPLLGLKYLLLAFFLYIILWKMDLRQVTAFQKSSYNLTADAKMLEFFLAPTRLAGGIMLFLVAVSFVNRNFWCRYACPYGALLGLLSLASPLAVRRDKVLCIDCKKCEKVCPGAIRITAKETVWNSECVGCLECVAACPQKDCLTVRAAWKWKLHHLALPAAVLGLFFLSYFGALATKRWHNAIPAEAYQKFYRESKKLSHPSF